MMNDLDVARFLALWGSDDPEDDKAYDLLVDRLFDQDRFHVVLKQAMKYMSESERAIWENAIQKGIAGLAE